MSGLVVPIDVAAFCVGALDARGPALEMAGASTDYRFQAPNSRPAFLGINVIREPTVAPLWPLETGVHLHWAMPDALTRGDTSSGELAFPALPNRWLVSRIVGDGQSAKHWIVRSDALSPAPPGGKPGPTVPVAVPATEEGAQDGRGFRYLGVWELFTPEWAEPAAGARALRDMTGTELHSVATGDIAFAAFYPNSRSSFGFRDDLADLATVPAELTYQVTGWYDTPANDPLHGGLTVPELQERLRWTVGPADGGPVTYSTYSGIVQGIVWDPRTKYLTDEAEPIDADVAIGNHPAEALAAYFHGRIRPGVPAVEELLTLFITGLLPTLVTPEAGQLANLEEALHELQFSSIDGGTIYTVMRGTDEDTGLPLPLADALNLLNTRQQAADVAADLVWQAKWQLFAAWYRLFEVEQQNQTAALNSFDRQFRLLPAINAWRDQAAQAAAAQKTVVERMLTEGLTLAGAPAGRYYTATEPVVLLAGQAAAANLRYGGDGRFHPAGYLVCRRADEVLRELTVGPATLLASQFAALAPAAPNHLPHPEITALVLEAALLDLAIDAAASGIAETDLAADLTTWLAGGAARYYGHPAGHPPSAVGVSLWPGGNPWTSLTLLWDAFFHPLLAPYANGAIVDYKPDFFTANYHLDPDNPRMIAYRPSADGIKIDPAKIDFTPGEKSGTFRLAGTSVLSTAAADNLRTELAKHDPQTMDPTLREMAEILSGTDLAMQGLTGFNDLLLTRKASLQLAIGDTTDARLPFRQATAHAKEQITSLTQIPPVAPQFHGHYSGVRAGYLKMSFQVMDPFGRKRPVRVGKLFIADSLIARAGGSTADGVVYAQPRVAQETRLQYHWLAADTTGSDEMNAHPATTPVCGWLLPDHLSEGFFIYTAQGDPLGTLTLRADQGGITWQATPGDQDTIDADIVTVLAQQNPHLRDMVLVLGGGTMDPPLDGSMSPAAFRAFWQAADTAITQIVPTAPASQAGLAALVGRALAVVQVSLRLERQGLAALDQAFGTLSQGQYTDTDHAAGQVRFPVVLGDLRRLDDGLVGYFRQAPDGGYDTRTFFSQAATGSDPRVAVPSPDNLLLRPVATPVTAPDTPPAETKLLMLVDPRAPVHATMGIVPTQSLTIPPEQYEDTLAGLELTFPVYPLLRAASGLAVPVPAISGFEWSWITEETADSGPVWGVDPELQSVTAGALWQYSPQTLTEGWLRLNPQLLEFRLNGPGGVPVVPAGATTSLELLITNKRGVPITFTPAAPGGGEPAGEGSLFYIHFGALVAAARVGEIRFTAPGWRFELLTDPAHGSYWAAAPDLAAVTIAPGEHLTMPIANVAVAAGPRAQASVYFDYYNLTGIDDGIDIAVLAITEPARR